MPRRKRQDRISDYHLQKIERQVALLRIALDEATLGLTPFKPPYDAITELQQNLRRALNLLNDQPADFHPPHRAPMSGG